jgi:hypothetical protein
MRRIAGMAAALCAGAAFSGCASVSPVAGPVMTATGFSYSVGKSTQDFAFPPDKVQAAVVGAMDDLRVHSVRQTTEPGAIYYEGTTADDRRALVTVRPFAGGTRLTSRIGLLGDEPLSRALMDRTGIRLGTLPPAPIPDKVPSKPGTLLSADGPDPQYVHEQAEERFYDKTRPW